MQKPPVLLRFFRFVRRQGVPHEETVAIPVFVTLAAITQAERLLIPIWLAASLSAFFAFVSGAWLGLAWTKPRVASVIIRTVLIAALIVGGYAFGKHPNPGTIEEYRHDFVLTIQSYGGLFYAGWMSGSMLREITVTLYISTGRRQRFETGWPYRAVKALWSFLRHPRGQVSYWSRLAVGREIKDDATVFDLLMARFIDSTFSPDGVTKILSVVVAICAGLLALYGLFLSYVHPWFSSGMSPATWEWNLHG
jgi:hypothetical protein